MDYTVEYSNRKTIGIYIKGEKVIVRAPKRAPKKLINEFVLKNEEWIKTHLEKSIQKADFYDSITYAEKKKYKKLAKEYFTIKTREYADIMRVIASTTHHTHFFIGFLVAFHPLFVIRFHILQNF